MKIEKELLTSIENSFRGLKLHNGFKLIKTNFDKRRVEATYKHKDIDMCVEMEMKFFVPRFHVGHDDPIEEVVTLANICRGLSIHDSYQMYGLNVTRETISAEFFNPEDSTSIKIKTLR